MAITESERYQLVEGLIEVLGMERAETLLKCVLLEGREQLATKQDLEVVDARLRGEFGERFGELRGEFGTLRGEFGERFGELRGEFGERFGELRGYIDSTQAKQARIYLLTVLGLAVTVWVAVLVPLIL